jgi:F-type H+/Na+-transporting ATPase subunit beta
MNTTTTGTVPTGDALFGRVIDPAGAPLDGRGPLDAASHLPIDQPVGADAAPLPDQALETGIKVIDLYAPITRGGTHSLTAVPGVGLIVISSELIQRVATRHGGCAVMACLEDEMFPIKDLAADLRGSGIDSHTAVIVGQPNDPPEVKRQVGLMGLTLAESFCDQGRETLLFLDEGLIAEGAIERLKARRRGTKGALTVFVWRLKTRETFDAARAAAEAFALDLDGRLIFSIALAKQSIWPAIDSLASTSRLLDQRIVDAEHARVARAAQDLLRSYGDAEIGGAAGDDPRLRARARRVLLFQGQPFFVAETFTGLPGEYVSLAETVRGFGELVAGLHDDVPEEAFRFVGTLDQALAKATA